MSEHEDYFKCRDCKDEYRCPINNTDSRACGVFASKRKVRLPIVEALFSKIALSKSGEPITFSEKEIVVLTEVLYKDLAIEEQQERNKEGSSIEEDLIVEKWKKYMLKGME